MNEQQHIIFHIDVNSAFLSWSALKQLREDPTSVDLRMIPSAVGGDVNSRRGVITAKSIPAKAYGVQTGEPVVSAFKKCPQLVLVRSDFRIYREYSKQFIALLSTYSPLLEQVSIDEAYLDVTDLLMHTAAGHDSDEVLSQKASGATRNEAQSQKASGAVRDKARSLAEQIRNRIKTELGFTVNVGISENKLLAKTASDFSKPDRTHTLFPEELSKKFHPLPIRKLFGCGQATADKLMSIGIRTIGDAAAAPPELLRTLLGEKGGDYISRSASGIGSTQVHSTRQEAKGYSNETTTPFDINADNYKEAAPPIVAHLSEKVAQRLQRDGVFAATLGISVKTDEFHRRSRQRKLNDPSNDPTLFMQVANELLKELLTGTDGIFAGGNGIRLIGVSATNLEHGTYRQLSLFDLKPPEKQQSLDRLSKQLQQRFGTQALFRGSKLSKHTVPKKEE